MTRLVSPFPLFLDGGGDLLDGGYIYIGTPGTDPTVPANRISLFTDTAYSIPVAQPLRTLGGRIVQASNPVSIFFPETDFSLTVQDSSGSLVEYTPSALSSGGVAASYQPIDSDLTAIAALSSTAFGRNLLTMANSAALKAAAGVVDGLPLTGGTVSGDITRSGAGVHLFFATAGMTGGEVFLTPNTDPDPRTGPGQVWATYTP